MQEQESPKASLPSSGKLLPLVFGPSKILETASSDVPDEALGSDTLYELGQDLVHTMIMTGGIGLSAVQVGVPWRVFAIGVSAEGKRLDEGNAMVFVNPEIIEVTTDARPMREGCLSFPTVSARIVRPSQVKLKARRTDGSEMEFMANGWFARCILHEMDHLKGVTFLEAMGSVEKRIAKKAMLKFAKTMKRDGGQKENQ